MISSEKDYHFDIFCYKMQISGLCKQGLSVTL